MPVHFPAYVGLALLVVVAPGPDFAVVMKNCLMYGRRPGLFTSIGVVTGLLVQGTAAALGVAALIVRSAVAFDVLKVAGAAYLGFLGAQALRSALARRRAASADADATGTGRSARPAPAPAEPRGEADSTAARAEEPVPARRGGRGNGRWPGARAFRQGFLSNIANPKVLAFYFSLLPQFVGGRGPALPQVLVLAATHAFFALAWLLLVVAVLNRLREFLRRPRVRRSLEGVTGLALVGLGVRLITSSR